MIRGHRGLRRNDPAQDSRGLWLAMALTAGLASASLAGPAHAALGAKVASVDVDRKVMRAVVSSTQLKAATNQALSSPNGVVTREYSGGDGTVFAVAWSGPMRPNLKQLLGAYYSRFQLENQPVGKSRRWRPLASNDQDLIVRTGGHPGAFWGYAYLPSAMPSDFDLTEITKRAQ
jgi:hypothetical protein